MRATPPCGPECLCSIDFTLAFGGGLNYVERATALLPCPESNLTTCTDIAAVRDLGTEVSQKGPEPRLGLGLSAYIP